MRLFVAVAIALALGFALRWVLVTPSPPVAQVQARIEAARSRPAPPLQPLPELRPDETQAWTMARDPFAAGETPEAPTD